MHRLRLVADCVSVSRAGARRRGRGERHVRRRFVGDRRRAHATRATVSPVEEFPLSHPASLDPKTKTCLGLGAVADAEAIALPASGRTWDPETGACSAATLTGGELLFNPGSATGSSFANLGKSRTSRVVVARDAGGESYLVLVNGARGDASGGRVGVEIVGRDLADGSSRPNNAGNTAPAGLLHPKTPAAVSTVGACALDSASAEDCFAFDGVNGQAALRWAWNARAPRARCWAHSRGRARAPRSDGSWAKAWTKWRLARTTTPPAPWPGRTSRRRPPRGARACACARAPARTTAPTAPRAARAREGEDDARAWCASTERCLARAQESACPETPDAVGECLEACGDAVSCAACAHRPGCGWCHSSATCHGADVAGRMAKGGDAECAASDFAAAVASTFHAPEAAATCEAARSCPGARLKSGVPAVVGHQPVAVTCNGRGACDAASRRCSCDRGFAGEACEIQCKGPSAAAPCADRGKCDARDGTCHCKPGFEGEDCNIVKEEASPTCACGLARVTPEVRRRNAGVHRPAGGRGRARAARAGPGRTANRTAPARVRPRSRRTRGPSRLCCAEAGGTCPPRARTSRSARATTATPTPGPEACASRRRARRGRARRRAGRAFDAASGLMACACRGGYAGQGCNTRACTNGGT